VHCQVGSRETTCVYWATVQRLDRSSDSSSLRRFNSRRCHPTGCKMTSFKDAGEPFVLTGCQRNASFSDASEPVVHFQVAR